VVPVDLTLGQLGVGLDGGPACQTFSTHPDHGATIAGVRLDRFEEATALAIMSLSAFPRISFAGMDVAMTTDGPVILEANVQPSHNGAAYAGVPTRDVFEA
jgi:glutathione synthase/RimK-type ligase-like ATP-grasp enzyme